jgi:hypothetical protein
LVKYGERDYSSAVNSNAYTNSSANRYTNTNADGYAYANGRHREERFQRRR